MPLSPTAASSLPLPSRSWEIDALRGLMLVLMTSTHLPTWFAYPASQPFGFVSAAEGFVFLSAYMAGLVYTRRAMHAGLPAMRRAFLRRAAIIYLCQAACLLFLFTVIATLGIKFHQPAANRLLWFYLQEPVTAFWASLALVYNPALLDILPVYIIYMLLSPWVLSQGLQRGWLPILALSGGLWLAAQFGLSTTLYNAVGGAIGLPVPYSETGAFETYAWQLLWVTGMWLGAYHARTPGGERFSIPRWVAWPALGLALVLCIWRHLSDNDPFVLGPLLAQLFDKWHLGPLRVLNFFILLVVVLQFGPWLSRVVPRMRWLETLGAASLPVFCAHLVLVLLVLALLGDSTPERPRWLDPLMFVACIMLLHIVARIATAAKSGPGAGLRRAGSHRAAAPSSEPDAGPQRASYATASPMAQPALPLPAA